MPDDLKYYRWAYELLRDAVIEHLDPQDDDRAEPAIMADAIRNAGEKLKQDAEQRGEGHADGDAVADGRPA